MERQDNITSRRGFMGLMVSSAIGALVNAAAGEGEAPATRPATAPAATQPGTLRLGVLADIQYADQPAKGSRFYRSSLEKLQAAVADLNARQPTLDFVIHLGDTIDAGGESFAKVRPLYDKLAMPHYQVLGNHDYSFAYAQPADVLKLLGMDKPYYSFVRAGWRFVVLDGNEVSFYANTRRPNTPQADEAANAIDPKLHAQAVEMSEALRAAEEPNWQHYNGGVGPAQLAWLETQLAEADAAGQRAIVICHFPVLPRPAANNLWNDRAVLKILSQHRCPAVFLAGHHHPGNYVEQPGLGSIVPGVHHVTFRGMVETPDQTAYAVVELRGDRIIIEGVGREPSRELKLRQDT